MDRELEVRLTEIANTDRQVKLRGISLPEYIPSEPFIPTYMMSLFHAAPFLFRVDHPQPHARSVCQPPDRQEMTEIAQELLSMATNRELQVAYPLNPMQPQLNRQLVYEALIRLPIPLPYIDMVLTWTSAVYPYHYGWNLPARSPSSLIFPTLPIPASSSNSYSGNSIFSYHYEGILIRKGQSESFYRDQSHIPPRRSDPNSGTIDYPYGWTTGIEQFCQNSGHHPDCTDPIRRAFIEREFIASTIHDPSKLGILDDYVQVIYNNYSGRNLQWLASSPNPMYDNIRQRAALSGLYADVDNQDGQVLHTKNGLRIIIPEERWINWKKSSPRSQDEFTRVAWAQMTQFDKIALMTSLRDGKLGNDDIYIDFSDDSQHDRFWSEELQSVRRYYIDLIAQLGAFHTYNQYVMQELTYFNEPIDLSELGRWSEECHPYYVYLPYSHTMLKWKHNKWEYEFHSENSLSPCSSYEPLSYETDSDLSQDPIDEFEAERILTDRNVQDRAHLKARGGML
jgi:hypothetical protein